MDSILTSVKKLLGIDEAYEHFAADLIMHINSVFMILCQMGVGPSTPYVITDSSDEWTDFSDDVETMNAVRSYVFMKVRMIFDPPQNGTLMDSLKQLIDECEWRLNVLKDKTNE